MTSQSGDQLSQPPADPYRLFDSWYRDADACEEIKYAHAMCLSTVDVGGFPTARTVLLKLWDRSGFVFFTDAESPKALALVTRPHAAMTFYWGLLDRQVRIRGEVEQASDEISDRCFRFRPRGSRIAAWASRQSRVLESRSELERMVDHYTEKFAGVEDVPRPPHWQAYRLRPRTLEFWQARADRLHDRLLYTARSDGTWTLESLYP
ncbi:MAG: pyridoxamine 5'-phosphate oxidase [Thermoanaerobaculia bacterium]